MIFLSGIILRKTKTIDYSSASSPTESAEINSLHKSENSELSEELQTAFREDSSVSFIEFDLNCLSSHETYSICFQAEAGSSVWDYHRHGQTSSGIRGKKTYSYRFSFLLTATPIFRVPRRIRRRVRHLPSQPADHEPRKHPLPLRPPRGRPGSLPQPTLPSIHSTPLRPAGELQSLLPNHPLHSANESEGQRAPESPEQRPRSKALLAEQIAGRSEGAGRALPVVTARGRHESNRKRNTAAPSSFLLGLREAFSGPRSQGVLRLLPRVRTSVHDRVGVQDGARNSYLMIKQNLPPSRDGSKMTVIMISTQEIQKNR